MPFDYLWCEEEIYAGNGTVIRGLINDIKQAYSNEFNYLNSQK